MKNLFTNLMKNTAKRTQNTGGGASRQITARFEGAQMKTTSLISGCSAVDVPMPSYGASDEHPMSTRSASDERRWNSRVWKYVACMLMVFVLSIGQMWGATTAPADTVTAHAPGAMTKANLVSANGRKYEVYYSNNASKESWLVGSNTSTVTQAAGTNKWCNIGSGCAGSNNNISTAFTIHEFVSNVKGNNANKLIQVQSIASEDKCVVMVVSGYDSIAVLDKGEVKVFAEIWNGSSYGTQSQITAKYKKSQSSHYKRAHVLDNTKRYRLTLTYGTSGNTNKNLVGFSLCPPAYGATHDLSNVSRKSGDIAGTKAATKGYDYNVTFEAAENYTLPSTITVTIGGDPATVGTDYTWNSTTGEFNVPANKVTGAIVVAIEGEISGTPCSATAYAGADKETTVGVGVAMAATAASSGYTGAWSIKAGSPSTATSQLGTTSSNTMTFTPNTYGTYTLVWTVTDNEDGSCSASDEATVTVPAPTHTISYTNLKGADNSANPTTYTEGVGVASFANLRHVVGYDFTEWSPSSISPSATTDQTIDAQWTVRAAATGTGTLTYALAFGTSTITTSSITRNNGALYDATNISTANTSFVSGGEAPGNGCSGKLATTSSKSESNYVELTFKIADGYTFTPSGVSIKANAVSNNKTLEVELKDNAASPHTKSVTAELAAGSTSGGVTYNLDFSSSPVTLEGTVTLKIYVYGSDGATKGWRIGPSVIVNGTVAVEEVCETAPTVTAGSNSSVTATTATVSCEDGISSLGSAGCSISSYGFVLNTSTGPTLSNTTHEVGTTYTTTGESFEKELTGLTAGTTYYVRPYATNGNGTSYGTETSFTTLPSTPTFSPTSGSTVSGSQTITITGHSGSTVYYAWATSSQSADDIYNSGSGSHGTTDAGTASVDVVDGKTLYAISRLSSTNSAVGSASYTVDNTAPTLSSSTPANGATDIDASGNITLTFIENVTINDASKFSLTGGSGTLSTGSATASGTTVTIPYSGLANSMTYTLSTFAGAVQDAAGNTSAALSSISFTTAAAPIYYYKDATHYVSSTYKNPEGDDPSEKDNVPLTTPWTICSSCLTGVSSVVAKGCVYDNKSATEQPWMSAYIKVQSGGTKDTKNITVTLASGYTGTLTMKVGKYSDAKTTTVSLCPLVNSALGEAITPTSGSVGGIATTENNFNTIVWPLATAGGTYVFTAANDNAYISQIEITTKQVATAQTVTVSPAGGNICSGGSAIIGLANSQSGVSYQLYKGESTVGDPVAGTGSDLTLTDTITVTGTYTVKSVENSSYAAATMSGSVTVSLVAATSITTQPSAPVEASVGVACDISGLVAAGANFEYQWYTCDEGGNNKIAINTATNSSAATATLTITPASTSAEYYICKVHGYCGDDVYTNVVTIEAIAANTLTYNANGGTGTMSATLGNGSVTLRTNTFTYSGYTFLGWATSDERADAGTVDHADGASYDLSADATLYAVWAENCYSMVVNTSGSAPAVNDAVGGTQSGGTMKVQALSSAGSMVYGDNGIKFNANGDVIEVTLLNKMQAGTIVSFTMYRGSASDGSGLKLLNSSGTQVKAMTWDAAGAETRTIQYKVVADDGLDGSKVFRIGRNNTVWLKSVTVANCAPITYDLTVAVNNGEYGSVDESSVTDIPENTTTSSSSNTFTVNEITVTATPTKSTAEYTYAFSSWSNLPAMVTANATVTAIFTRTANSYTLAWNTNGGSDLAGKPTSGTTAFGTTLTKPTEPTKSNYTFAGWNTANDGSGTNYTGAMTMPAADATYYAKWTQAVTLDANTANHGSGDNQSATAVWNATGLTGFVATAAATDYAVFGYFTDATGGTQILNADGTFAAEDISGYVTGGKWSRTDAAPTLYAHLQQAVQVTYNGNGDDGTGSVPTDANDYKDGDTVTVLGNTGDLAKTDKVFNGWNTAADGTGTFYPVGSTLIMPDGDVTLYAVWNSTAESCLEWAGTPSSFTNGSMIVSRNLILESGGSLGTSSQAVWSGSGSKTIFSIDGSAKYLQGHLKGGQDISKITISAANNQGANNDYAYVILYCANSAFSTGVTYETHASPSKSDAQDDDKLVHEFTPTAGTKYFRIYRYVSKFSDANITAGDGKTIYVYGVEACYTALTGVYDVEFNANTTADVDNMPEEIVNVPDGSKISEPLTVPTRTGYTFDRWCTDEAGTPAFDFSTGTITAATTLYAKWTPIDYTVTYSTPANSNSYTIQVAGDAAGSADKIANYGQTITLTAVPASTAYVFRSWTITKTDDASDIADAVSLSGQTATATFTMPAYGVTVTATFADAYTLTYNANGVTADMPAIEYHGEGSTTLSATVPTADDCVFLGWNTAADGSDNSHTFIAAGGAFTMPAEEEVLYAQWGPKVTTPAAAEAFTLATGRKATLTVAATTCSGSLSYQWYKDGVEIGDAITTDYVIDGTDLTAGTDYAYTCRVSTDAHHYTISPAITVTGIAECGWEVIAGATRTSGAKTVASYEGSMYKEAMFNTDNDGKISGGKYVSLTLTSGNYFQNGDTVAVTVTEASDQGDKGLHIFVGTSTPGTEIGTLAYANTSANAVNKVVLANVPAETSSITIHRSTSTTQQNWFVDAISVSRYSCPGTNESKAAGNWNDPTVWAAGKVPTVNDRVYIDRELTVNTTAAKAKEVIMDGGKLIVAPNQALVVTGTITNAEGNPTTAAELKVESSSAGNGTLIFQNDGNAATVQMYSKAEAPKIGTWKWQYAAAPAAVNALYNYYGGYLYKWNDGWNSVSGSDNMELFAGYCVSYPTAGHTFEIEGELAATGSVDLTIPAGKEWVVGNSWTAPIQIKQMATTDFVNVTPTIYLFNTGMDNAAESTAGAENALDRYAASTYVTIPIDEAGTGTLPSVISSLQGFYVANSTGLAGTLKLDYAKHVRPNGGNSVVNGPMHAPERSMSEKKEVLTITADGSRYSSNVMLIAHEDYTFGYDPGHDGENINEAGVGPLIYTLREDGTHDDVSAIPEYEGAVVGFVAGEDSEYTFRFTYDGADIWYLNDTKLGQSTLISNENTYTFTVTGDDATRFVISKTSYNAPSVTTGVGNQVPSTKARKLMIDGILYIIREGRIYTAEGALVK